MNIIDRLKNSSPFIRSFVLLMGGSVFGQVIGVAASPILTRLYTPSDFGEAGVFISVLTVLSVCSMLRYEYSIPACTTEEEAAQSTVLAALVGVAFSVILLALVPPARVFLPRINPGSRAILPYLYLIPVGVAASSVYLALSLWAVREQNFKLLSAAKITQASTGVALQVGTVFVYPGPLGLIIGQIASQSGGLLQLIRNAWAKQKTAFRAVNAAALLATARRFRRYPLLSVPAIGLESLFLNVPIMVIASVYGTAVAGWMALVQRVFFFPGLLLARNLGQVLLGEMSAMAATDVTGMEHLFWRRLKQMSLVAICACLPIALAAPFIIPWVFGKQWANAWICAELLLPMLLASFTSATFGTALDVLQRQDLHLLREIGRFLLLAIAMGIILWEKPGWKSALVIISIMSTMAYAWYLGISWWAIHQAPSVRRRRTDAGTQVESATVLSPFPADLAEQNIESEM